MIEVGGDWLKACFVGSMVSSFALATVGFTGEVRTVGELLLGTLSIGLYGFAIAVSVSAIYGFPVYFTLRKLGALNILSVLVAGALPGVIWNVVTDGMWVNPILWHGVVIAGLYYIFDKKDESPNKLL